MTMDWVLTLLALSLPFLLAATILALALITSKVPWVELVSATRRRANRTMGAQRRPLGPNDTAPEREVHQA